MWTNIQGRVEIKNYNTYLTINSYFLSNYNVKDVSPYGVFINFNFSCSNLDKEKNVLLTQQFIPSEEFDLFKTDDRYYQDESLNDFLLYGEINKNLFLEHSSWISLNTNNFKDYQSMWATSLIKHKLKTIEKNDKLYLFNECNFKDLSLSIMFGFNNNELKPGYIKGSTIKQSKKYKIAELYADNQCSNISKVNNNSCKPKELIDK